MTETESKKQEAARAVIKMIWTVERGGLPRGQLELCTEEALERVAEFLDARDRSEFD